MTYNYPNYNAWNYREPDAYFSDDSDGGDYPTDPDDTDSDDEVDMRYGDYREFPNGDPYELEDYFEEEDDDSERPAYDWENRRAEPEDDQQSEEAECFYWLGGVRLQERWDYVECVYRTYMVVWDDSDEVFWYYPYYTT
jgi:hypothetical protein